MNKTFLAIDFGTKRVGLAKSDPLGIIASALETLSVKSMRDSVEQVLTVIAEVSPDALVVGYPLHDSGARSTKCDEIDQFIEQIKKQYDGPVHTVDESHTSDEAKGIVQAHGKKTGKKKGRIDRIAAVLILERFLTENQT